MLIDVLKHREREQTDFFSNYTEIGVAQSYPRSVEAITRLIWESNYFVCTTRRYYHTFHVKQKETGLKRNPTLSAKRWRKMGRTREDLSRGRIGIRRSYASALHVSSEYMLFILAICFIKTICMPHKLMVWTSKSRLLLFTSLHLI